jgi:hypothetical protein
MPKHGLSALGSIDNQKTARPWNELLSEVRAELWMDVGRGVECEINKTCDVENITEQGRTTKFTFLAFPGTSIPLTDHQPPACSKVLDHATPQIECRDLDNITLVLHTIINTAIPPPHPQPQYPCVK